MFTKSSKHSKSTIFFDHQKILCLLFTCPIAPTAPHPSPVKLIFSSFYADRLFKRKLRKKYNQSRNANPRQTGAEIQRVGQTSRLKAQCHPWHIDHFHCHLLSTGTMSNVNNYKHNKPSATSQMPVMH